MCWVTTELMSKELLVVVTCFLHLPNCSANKVSLYQVLSERNGLNAQDTHVYFILFTKVHTGVTSVYSFTLLMYACVDFSNGDKF